MIYLLSNKAVSTLVTNDTLYKNVNNMYTSSQMLKRPSKKFYNTNSLIANWKVTENHIEINGSGTWQKEIEFHK